jgi:hypothetical protein
MADRPDADHGPEPEDLDVAAFLETDPESDIDYDPTEHMTREELAQLEHEAEFAQGEYEAALIRDAIRGISKDAARAYLSRYGDAVDARITACLEEARQLVEANHPGPGLTLAATALEIAIRFLLLQPLVQGAFLSERWAAILADRVATGRTAEDRKLLPRILREWSIDVAKVKTPSGVQVWPFFVGPLRGHRDRFVHRADPVSADIAIQAIACAETFRGEVVGAVAKRLGFTLEVTNRWSVIPRGTVGGIETFEEFATADPFAELKLKVKAQDPP